jgi:dTDP-4-dehydrorhamnose 3,5-epimerase
MNFTKTAIPGCYEILPTIADDSRGRFVKVFHEDLFKKNHLETNFVESFYSISKKNVLRGLHFQLPPHAYTKLVYCISGEVLDVLVDLRVGSPAYGKPCKLHLSAERANILYIPIGIAHGFYTLSENATMIYQTSCVHEPTSDHGINWQSFPIWPNAQPITSERDSKHPLLKDFNSPFKYTANE